MKKRAQIISNDTANSRSEPLGQTPGGHQSATALRIQTIRGQKVILDSDLAEVYGAETKALNRAVKRNLVRFPPDFIFQLTRKEFADLRRQSGTSSSKYGGRRFLPYAFTENGAVMVASILNSPEAIRMSIFVVRAFIPDA